jgi:hypothetical protein
MERFLVIVAMFFSVNAFSATPSGVPVIGPGASTIAGSSSFISLSNPAGGSGTYAVFSLDVGDMSTAFTAGKFYPFFKSGVAYSVPSGKKTVCFDLTSASVTTLNYFAIFYATASFAYNAASVTGEVNYCGGAAKLCKPTSATAYSYTTHPGVFIFDNTGSTGVFPGVEGNAAAFSIHMNCYEN